MTNNTHGGRRHGLSPDGPATIFRVKMTEELKARIQDHAAEIGVSASEWLRDLAESALPKAKKKKSRRTT